MRPLHHSDSDPGWINRKFKDLERQLRQLRTTTVVNLSAADPSTLPTANDFEQDGFTVSAPGNQSLQLTYVPVDDSEHVYWNGLYQPGSEWTRNGSIITALDPDGILQADDELIVEYVRSSWAPSQLLPIVVAVGSAAAATNVTSLDIPIAGAEEGDLLILGCARHSTLAVSDGWTPVNTEFSAGGGGLQVHQKISDGTEVDVTISGTSDVYSGVVVVLRHAALVTSATQEVSPATATFSSPEVSAAMPIAFVVFDGDNVGGGETITSVTGGTTLANLIVGSGVGLGEVYGLAAVQGHSQFTASQIGGTVFWLGITVGV